MQKRPKMKNSPKLTKMAQNGPKKTNDTPHPPTLPPGKPWDSHKWPKMSKNDNQKPKNGPKTAKIG